MKALLFIRDIFKKYSRLFIINTALVVLLGIVDICALVAIGPLIDFLTHSDLVGISPLTERVVWIMNFIGLPVTLGVYSCVFLIFVSLSSGLRIFVRYSLLKTKYVLGRDLLLGTFDDFFKAKWYFFSSSRQGMLLNTFIRELGIVGDAFGAMGIFFAGILQLLICLAVPFAISWQVTTISLFTTLAISLPFVFLGKISYRWGRLNTTTANQIGVVTQESLGLAKVILGFGNQRKGYNNLDTAYENHRKVTVKSQTLSTAIPMLYQPLGAIVLIVALLSARIFKVPFSEMTVLLLALLRSVFFVGRLVESKHSLENSFPSYEQVNNLRIKAKGLKQPSGGREFSDFNKEIKIEGVWFAYPGHKSVLEDINMTIPKGKMIAVVGDSGAGKTTFIDLIMGFNEPAKGQIAFDGVSLQSFDVNSYRQRIGYVPQDSVLFNMTIRDNLLWAKDDATQEEIVEACRQANADEFIVGFSKGYDTLVGDRGVRLSGGQRQRIALARAILRRPVLLFLDEATSSLDTNSERLIQKAIENVAKETTVIVIAHRLSTIINSDFVYVLREGRVVEKGKYSDLAKIDGYFNRMVKLQFLETAK
ncbi:MAG: ABC transporter ATP-binding protein [bacterium]